MNNKLTQKQENFTRYIFKGMNQYDAYKAAGYAVETQARGTIDKNASRLANNGKVQQRLAQLNDRIDNRVRMTKEERLEVLTEIAREPVKQPVTAKEVILSIAEQNKMLGDYAPEKHAILGDIYIEVVYVNRNKNQIQGRTANPALPPG